MPLRLATAGESHGPALVAIVTGLPAGLVLDRAAIDADLRRRQAGYGRSPRQQIETDEVEVLAGLRHGRTLGTPLALVVRNRDHKNWTWGMSPWPPEGEPQGKGTKPVTLPRPGHADLAGVLKYGLDDVRNALERASARHTAVHVAAGGVAKALLAAIGVTVAGSTVDEEALRARIDEARAERDTVGGVVEMRARGRRRPGLGSYAAKEDRLDARLAAAVMGIQAVKGVEIGDGFALAGKRGSEAHDEIETDRHRDTNHAGGIEAGISNGEEIVVRAAMKPLPTLMKPLGSVDLATGEAGEGARRALRRGGGRGARGRGRGRGRVGARPRGAREVRRRRGRRLRRRPAGLPRAHRWAGPSSNNRHWRPRRSTGIWPSWGSWARARRRSAPRSRRGSGGTFVDVDRSIEERAGSDRGAVRGARARRRSAASRRGGPRPPRRDGAVGARARRRRRHDAPRRAGCSADAPSC